MPLAAGAEASEAGFGIDGVKSGMLLRSLEGPPLMRARSPLCRCCWSGREALVLLEATPAPTFLAIWTGQVSYESLCYLSSGNSLDGEFGEKTAITGTERVVVVEC